MYSAHDLLDYLDYEMITDIDTAIDRAINVCHSVNMPVNENFMMIYRAGENGQLQRDWRLSPLAYYLVILNGDPVNINVARAHVGVLMKVLEDENLCKS